MLLRTVVRCAPRRSTRGLPSKAAAIPLPQAKASATELVAAAVAAPRQPNATSGGDKKPMQVADLDDDDFLRILNDNMKAADCAVRVDSKEVYAQLVKHGIDPNDDSAPSSYSALGSLPSLVKRRADVAYFDVLSEAIAAVLVDNADANKAFVALSPVDRIGALMSPVMNADILKDTCDRLISEAAESTNLREVVQWRDRTEQLQQQMEQLLCVSMDDGGAAAELAARAHGGTAAAVRATSRRHVDE